MSGNISVKRIWEAKSIDKKKRRPSIDKTEKEVVYSNNGDTE